MTPFPGLAPLRRKRFCLRHSSRRDDRRRLELTRNSADYEEDFYAWTVEQAHLLRSGDLSAIDIENIAEEIESMGRSDRRAIESRLAVLLTHLLKWQIQERMRSRSWAGTIGEQRRRIAKLLRESPSLHPFVGE